MRYRLRTLLIVLALGPPLIAGLCAVVYLGWARSQGVIGTDEAVQRAMEDAKTVPPWDGVSNPYEPYEETERKVFGDKR